MTYVIRGYVIDVYVVSNGLPMLKNRKLMGLWKSVRCNRVYVLTESIITKFYCIYTLQRCSLQESRLFALLVTSRD